MVAFAAAVAAGFDYVETDVHATADGVVVACHDATLTRVAGLDRPVAQMRWSELRMISLPGGAGVPTLAEVLATWPSLRVNIDVKHGPAVPGTARAIARAGALDRVCVASFSDVRLGRLRRLLGAGACTALGPAEVAALAAGGRFGARAVAPWIVGRCAQVPERIGPLRLVDRRFIQGAHRLGLAVHVWTVNDAAAVSRLLDLGVDGIMTDDIGMLREVLRDRGVWPS